MIPFIPQNRHQPLWEDVLTIIVSVVLFLLLVWRRHGCVCGGGGCGGCGGYVCVLLLRINAVISSLQVDVL